MWHWGPGRRPVREEKLVEKGYEVLAQTGTVSLVLPLICHPGVKALKVGMGRCQQSLRLPVIKAMRKGKCCSVLCPLPQPSLGLLQGTTWACSPSLS